MTEPLEPHGTIFDEDADLYDEVRPAYPPELFDDLAELADLRRGSRVLELGAGTGQATLALAGQGYDVVAVEPGQAMAKLAREKLRQFPSVKVEVTPFEAWPLPTHAFDAVVAATSFHWIDPAVRVGKAADALRVGGALAVISTHHVEGGDSTFFRQVQACYERFDPSTERGLELTPEPELPYDSEEIDASKRFSPVTFRRYPWDETYTAEQYDRLLMSYSGHRALDSQARTSLLACIRNLIEEQFAGRITKRYLFQLAVAVRAR